LCGLLGHILAYLKEWAEGTANITISANTIREDFVLNHAEDLHRLGSLLSVDHPNSGFDVIIANPPYFKIPKSDSRAAAAASIVHGQPNIYGLFMAVSAALLREAGEFVFITPRSFASGPYFKVFREKFFNVIKPLWVHMFGCRRDAFRRDEVLQENVILVGSRSDGWVAEEGMGTVTISSSRSVADIGRAHTLPVPMSEVLDFVSGEMHLRLPATEEELNALRIVDAWNGNLKAYGLRSSTGPVVPFRAAEYIDFEGQVPGSHSPLLWMNNVHALSADWPIKNRKQQYIHNSATKLLLPVRNYVVMRRFSAKEEKRRLTAAPFLARDWNCPLVGFENHLNYIHRPGGTLSENEAFGLAALYNSTLLDTYFRCVNGNTQVSATELRAMPLPDAEVIEKIGIAVRQSSNPVEEIDRIVTAALDEAGTIERSLAVG